MATGCPYAFVSGTIFPVVWSYSQLTASPYVPNARDQGLVKYVQQIRSGDGGVDVM